MTGQICPPPEVIDRDVSPPVHVTVVMATRNGARFLPAQLASLARQSHRHWSLFVSDDGSQDGTRSILKDFSRHHPVQIVAGPEAGAAANFLAALCHPDLPPGIVALADQDDVWLRGKLARGLRRLVAASPGLDAGNAPPALYASESFVTDAALTLRARSQRGKAVPGFGNALTQNLCAGHTMMLNPGALRLIRAAGMPAQIGFHDWWIYQLLAGAEARLILDPLPSVLYRQHDQNLIGAAQGMRAGLHRVAKVASGAWGAMMQAQASALAQAAQGGILTPASVATLQAFRAAPRFGPKRRRILRHLGIKRSGRAGDLCLQAAALLGRL